MKMALKIDYFTMMEESHMIKASTVIEGQPHSVFGPSREAARENLINQISDLLGTDRAVYGTKEVSLGEVAHLELGRIYGKEQDS